MMGRASLVSYTLSFSKHHHQQWHQLTTTTTIHPISNHLSFLSLLVDFVCLLASIALGMSQKRGKVDKKPSNDGEL